jgi:hypothetical protein
VSFLCLLLLVEGSDVHVLSTGQLFLFLLQIVIFFTILLCTLNFYSFIVMIITMMSAGCLFHFREDNDKYSFKPIDYHLESQAPLCPSCQQQIAQQVLLVHADMVLHNVPSTIQDSWIEIFNYKGVGARGPRGYPGPYHT